MLAIMASVPSDARPLRLGDVAPDFTARTTMGAVRLSQYRGRWLLFFSHPADFTPVCTSEFLALARAADQFAGLECDLLALSVDSLYAHLAWVREIRRAFGIAIPFPVIEDPSLAIAAAYGMLDPDARDASTVRAAYVIDPAGVIRALSWYPATVGRSVDELLRLVAALRACDSSALLAPEGWHQGEPLLQLPATDVAALPDDSAGAAPWFCRFAS
jgi:peroxiredoxin (alkyl hydroperoxide reductase subunit C)